MKEAYFSLVDLCDSGAEREKCGLRGIVSNDVDDLDDGRHGSDGSIIYKSSAALHFLV